MSFLSLVGALSVVYLVVSRLERVPALRFRALPKPRPYLATDLCWYAAAIAATAVSVFLFRPQLAKFQILPIRDAVGSLPLVVKLGVGLAVFDFVLFAVHVGLHRSDTLWTVHKVHHSTLNLDGFATTRNHPVENLLRFVPGQAVLFLLGLPVSVVASIVAIAALYGVSNHSNLGTRVPWAEAIVVTPRLHRSHHVPSTTQHNFGTIFSIWDRLFGTLVRRDTAPEDRFGVPGEIDSYPQRFLPAFRHPVAQLREQHATKLAAESSSP